MLEVDTDTGFVTLLKHWCVEDCGTVINPQLVDEQIRGGVVQGIGAALFEHCLYDERGQLLNGNMADYLVPMACEMPDIEVGHVVTPTADFELGAKGAGEAGTAGAPGCGDERHQRRAAPARRDAADRHAVHAGQDSAGAGTAVDRSSISGMDAAASPVRIARTSAGEYAEQGSERWTSRSASRRSRKPPKKLTNWGRWGKDDQIGTLNHITPEDIVKAASLIRTGKVFALGIPLDRNGPQTGLFGGRFNPIHQMLATGTDADRRPAGLEQDPLRRRHAEAVRAGRDALGRARPHLLRGQGLQRPRRQADRLRAASRVLGIEHSKNKMVGRGVLLDIARFTRRRWLQGRRRHFQRRTRQMRQAQNVADRQGRFRHRAHRPDGALPVRRRSGAAMPAATRRA